MTQPRNADGDAAARAVPVVALDSVVREYTRGSGGGPFSRSDAPVVRAVDDVSLFVGQGEFVGLAGPSGSGKTTLLHIVAALDAPTAGRVELAGEDVTDLNERERARVRRDRVGIVFQRFHLLPALPAVSNVALPLVELGWSKAKRRNRAHDLLDKVGLPDRADHRPGALSGGEQQRVAIARALATEPDLVVADEPTGELDSKTSERVLNVLAEVAEERTVIVASHDKQALDRTSRQIQLHDGQLIHDSHA